MEPTSTGTSLFAWNSHVWKKRGWGHYVLKVEPMCEHALCWLKYDVLFKLRSDTATDPWPNCRSAKPSIRLFNVTAKRDTILAFIVCPFFNSGKPTYFDIFLQIIVKNIAQFLWLLDRFSTAWPPKLRIFLWFHPHANAEGLRRILAVPAIW